MKKTLLARMVACSVCKQTYYPTDMRAEARHAHEFSEQEDEPEPVPAA